MWYASDVLYAVLYVRVSCFVLGGWAVSRRYIDVCYCDMFSVFNPVASYGYLLPSMYLFIVDITNPDSFV